MNTITLEQVMHWRPCHSRKKILAMSGGKTEMTVLELLRLETVEPEDKLWVVLREEVLGAELYFEAGCRCAEHVLHYYEDKYPGDMRPRNGIEAARQYANGEITREELCRARDAAQAAAREKAGAAADAALDAAWAARAAAREAALVAADAALDAAWAARAAAREKAWAVVDAAWAADRAAARDAERRWQVNMLIKLLEEEK